jgi:hypothetical protein
VAVVKIFVAAMRRFGAVVKIFLAAVRGFVTGVRRLICCGTERGIWVGQ